jgi:flavin-dependent dehydrogenase
VIVADGSLSRFGRALGASRDKTLPYGLAARAYFDSPFSGDPFLESQLALQDEAGATIPGYGWVFPLGDGKVNVGVGVLSTFHRWKSLNTNTLMEAMVRSAPAHWDLDPATETDHRGGKLPMSFSVGPLVGPNWVMVGDAAGAINPFNGEGIAYAYETGRIAARRVEDALAADDLGLLALYKAELHDTYGAYYKVARNFVKIIGMPGAMRLLTRTGLRSRPLMEWVLKVMANLLDPEDEHMGERVYGALERVIGASPEL